jgi:hypothetical protein
MNAHINFSPAPRPLAVLVALVVIIISCSSSSVSSAFSTRAIPILAYHRAEARNNVAATAPPPPHHFHHSMTSTSTTSYYLARRKSTICLRMNNNFTPPDNKDIGGLNEGKYLFLFVLSACIWIFSIPPEFRRARFCTDEDVRLYPEKHCTTFNAWRTGISEYYANGGGVHFDFSIEGK